MLSALMDNQTQLKATEHHLPYRITQCYLPPDIDKHALP